MLYFLVLTKSTLQQRLFLTLFFGVGALFALQPELTTVLANSVGIGRGADLIFYLSVLLLFFLSFNFYLRFRTLEQRFTALARELAIAHPLQDHGPRRND
jgi:hypothetical protein